MIVIRPPQTPAEVRQIEDLHQAAWGLSERGIMPYNAIHAIMHAEGIVLAAFDGPQAVGFVLSFQGTVAGQRAHWSHLAAVLPEYRRQGLARDLKLAQRAAALAQGIKLVAWTFDPMRRENAHFSLEVLGAEAVSYHREIYGPMPDALNEGLLSDRLEVLWHLKSPRVKSLAKSKAPTLNLDPLPPVLLRWANSGPQIMGEGEFGAPVYLLELPADLEGVRQKDPSLAHAGYFALRELSEPAFKRGYKIGRVYFPPGRPELFCYVLEQLAPWFLYLLQTSDGTFYTGISNDLERRLAAHNAGRGAAYTATRRPVKLLAAWRIPDKGPALSAELALKKLSRGQKFALVQGGGDFMGWPRQQ